MNKEHRGDCSQVRLQQRKPATRFHQQGGYISGDSIGNSIGRGEASIDKYGDASESHTDRHSAFDLNKIGCSDSQEDGNTCDNDNGGTFAEDKDVHDDDCYGNINVSTSTND